MGKDKFDKIYGGSRLFEKEAKKMMKCDGSDECKIAWLRMNAKDRKALLQESGFCPCLEPPITESIQNGKKPKKPKKKKRGKK